MTENADHEGKVSRPLPSFRLETIKKRSAFKAASNGPRFSTPAFTMLRRPMAPEEASSLRFGFTVTKKVGNSVERNRIRRRLREAVRANAGQLPSTPMDLVLLARRAAISLDFASLVADIQRAASTLASRGDRKGSDVSAKKRSDNGKSA
ncbi:MAG: ribonuclease P protein component [Rhizobiales bacterium PAR1]|nr:MAG: ribonuclease P protein component [Rhizobiales bacterium PAR1]